MLDPDEKKPSVFVVNDDKQFLDTLEGQLALLGFAVRAFNTAGNFLGHYRPDVPGCLVLDLCMPGPSGLELYHELLCEGLRLPVIFVTAHADVTTAVAAMKAGAIDVLEKPLDRQVLADRVRKALVLDARWRKRDAQIAALEERMARLSERESETLRLIQAGESNKSMAARLLLTERAIEMRRSAIMRKLEVESVAELLNLTTTHRILTDLRLAAAHELLDTRAGSFD
jgi:FixJ family two-component response regulator